LLLSKFNRQVSAEVNKETLKITIKVGVLQQSNKEHYNISDNYLNVPSDEQALFLLTCLKALVLIDCPMQDFAKDLNYIFLIYET
jgi:hypothetical protein